ncbi:F-box protein [Hibiscus syriacus]|uniref:F-box protein n=1 Tax=Hibiscus syriacus TaxID=106335 RepID=A0A6A2ZKY5_HIBSY|nr:F-box protein [Hibiscus syriacus]
MKGGEGEEEVGCCSFNLNALPQDCIAVIISFTSPRDACRLSLVSTTFKSVADSDAVWESFLPSRYQDLIPSSVSFPSKKQLYLSLCENPVLIDGGRMSLSLERLSGKKCYMVSPRELHIVWSDTPSYWTWISIPESRFKEIPELLSVCWFEIRGKISIFMLSPLTLYKAYLVYKVHDVYGFEFYPVQLSVGFAGGEVRKRAAYLDPERGQRLHDWQIEEYQLPTPSYDDRLPKARPDGWLEVELGDFFTEGCMDDGDLEMSALEVEGGNWKGGLIIQGIEIRAITPNPSL